MNNMNIGEFLIINKVPFAYAHYLMHEGKKLTILEKNNVKLEDLPEWRQASKNLAKQKYVKALGDRKLTASEHKQCVRCFSIFLKYSNIVCIDCDDPNIHTPDELGKILSIPEINNNICWTKGNTKGFHIYVNKPKNWDDKWEGVKVFGKDMPDIDVIHSKRNMWESETKDIYNELQDFDFIKSGFIEKYPGKKRKELDEDNEKNEAIEWEETKLIASIYKVDWISIYDYETRAYVNAYIECCLKREYFKLIDSDYDSWIKIAYVLVNIGILNLSKYWIRICNQMEDKTGSTTQQRIDVLESVIKSVESSLQDESQKSLGFSYLSNTIEKKLTKGDKVILLNALHIEQPKFYYEYIKEEFERNHFLYYGELTLIKKDHTLHVYKHQAANNANAHYGWFDKGDWVSFLPLYYRDKHKRVVEHIVFRPDLPMDLNPAVYPNTYNNFHGFDIQKYGDMYIPMTDDEADKYCRDSIILKTIRTQLCNEDEGAFGYVLQWFAHLLFAAHEMGRFHTCLVFYSHTEGVGKSTILHTMFLDNIIGKNYGVKSSKMSELFGDFNGLLENKCYVVIEEGTRAGGVKFADVMKDNLVASDITINKKCANQYVTNNYVHVVCNTNNESVFTVTKSNRRYCVIQCREQLMPQSMAIELNETISDKNQLLKFVQYLRWIYDDTWNSEKYIIEEQHKKELWKAQMMLQINQVDQFLLVIYEDEEGSIYKQPFKSAMVPMQLYSLFRNVMTDAGRQSEGILTLHKFGRELHKIGIIQNPSRKYELTEQWVKKYLIEKEFLTE